MCIDKIAYGVICGGLATVAAACFAKIGINNWHYNKQHKELEAIKEHWKNAVTKEEQLKVLDEMWEWTNKYVKPYVET